jgi:diguanylate cyclase (GGDEF)-like protein
VQPIIAAALSDGIGRGEVTRRRRDGTVFPARVTLSLLTDDAGQLTGRVLCVQDISEQRRLEAELRNAALHDPLTSLPNRRLLTERLEHALARSTRAAGEPAVLLVDLNGFKAVNDTHGHEIGDQVLLAVAERLPARVRAGDTVARLGGDEFVVLLEDISDPGQPHRLADRLQAAIAQPINTAAGPITITASIGMRLAAPTDDVAALLRAADHAMYRAKVAAGSAAHAEPQPALRACPDPPTATAC